MYLNKDGNTANNDVIPDFRYVYYQTSTVLLKDTRTLQLGTGIFVLFDIIVEVSWFLLNLAALL